MSGARRAALAVIGCALLAPVAVFAQDPRAAVVQGVAREWLALADALDYTATWKAAGPAFRKAIPVGRWAAALKADREPRGPVVQRTMVATTFGSSFPGLPEGGNYAVVRFRTSFANETAGAEHVTLEVGADYEWHVIGYVIN